MNWKIIIIAGVILLSGDLYAKKVDGQALPFHGVFSGYITGYTEDPGAIADRCDPPPGQVAWAVISFGGWGNATHMGKTYMFAEHCSYRPEGGPPIGEYSEGILELTGANGAILTGNYSGYTTLAEPPMFYFMDFFTFEDGGTGRFSFASGEGIDLGSVNFDDGSFTIQMTGVISYSKR